MLNLDFINIFNIQKYYGIIHISFMSILFYLSYIKFCKNSFIIFIKKFWISILFTIFFALFGLTELNILTSSIIGLHNITNEVTNQLLLGHYLGSTMYLLTINILFLSLDIKN